MLGFAELSTPAKAVISLAFVLVLVVIAGLILRRIAGGKLKLPGQGGRARQPRLGVVDVFELDRQRQLILLRRDNVEHLVMIGGPNDVVVEASIVRAATRAQAAPQVDIDTLTAPVPADTQPPRGVIPARGPEPALKPEPAVARRPEPAFTTPDPPKPRESTLPPPGSRVAGGMAGAGIAAAGVAAAGVAAAAGAAGLARSATSDAAAPSPRPAPEPTLPPMAAPAEFEAELKRALGDAPSAPIIEPIVSASSLKADPAELSEMARQLEEALKRPNSGVVPAATLAKAEALIAASEPAQAVEDMPDVPSVAEDIAAPDMADMPVAGEPADDQPAPVAPADEPASEPALEIASAADAAAIEQAIQAEIAALSLEAPAPAVTGPGPETDLAAALELELAKAIALDVPGPEAVPVTDMAEAQDIIAPEPVLPEPVASGFTMPQALEDELFAALTAAEAKVVIAEPAPVIAPEAAPTAAPVEAKVAEMAEAMLAADKPAKDKPTEANATGVDPFSVEAIEAEFARLLNRSAPPKV